MNEKFRRWLCGDTDVLENITDTTEIPDAPRERIKEIVQTARRTVLKAPEAQRTMLLERKGFHAAYTAVAIVSCILLIGVLLFIVAGLPLYGQENVRADEVIKRYIESGLKETGAVNIVSGMILDYRAFDTLGESHVLFTALVCVMILLRRDKKNMRPDYEDYYTVREDVYFDISKDSILGRVGTFLIPCIFVYGLYVLLNGQISPGGGFSGGAVMGAGMIMFSAAFGFDTVDKFFTLKLSSYITFAALSFYSFAKGYVFFMGANGLDNGIPKGAPGAILSGGLILPLDVAVGLVVACTMFGFYSLFRRGSIGGNGPDYVSVGTVPTELN